MGWMGAAGRLPRMSAFVLTWNPTEQWQGDPRRAEVWSVGPNDPGIEDGDRLFLLRQGGNRGNRGIVAVGRARGSVDSGKSWSNSAEKRLYVDVEWSMLENCVPIDRLEAVVPEGKWSTRYRRSGVALGPDLAAKVERIVMMQKQDLDR